ncbi:hypothetical protein [Plantactinospora endophytica]|uniref:hypothetical protein n=1 Tax=Plantactinospora endophytica TaxID=673535 RepID=UPI0019421F86|nr:hypothetical protein [Plantactinospora endophytica]
MIENRTGRTLIDPEAPEKRDGRLAVEPRGSVNGNSGVEADLALHHSPDQRDQVLPLTAPSHLGDTDCGLRVQQSLENPQSSLGMRALIPSQAIDERAHDCGSRRKQVAVPADIVRQITIGPITDRWIVIIERINQ